MTIRRLFQSPRARRGIAAGAIVLSLGGLVLYRAPATASPPVPATPSEHANGIGFDGPGASGTLALSHGQVLANGPQRVFAELRITADDSAVAAERAPLAMVIVLDTSGSMSGEKLIEARRSVRKLLDRMDDDDQVAFVRYDTQAHLVQQMDRVGSVRSYIDRTLESLRADGGTNIPDGLAVAMRQMEEAEPGRVRRVVLVSDGLDSHRDQAEGLARRGTDAGVTVSSLGIGLDFDESYMVGLSRAGRGNFGFVENPSALSTFLRRELEETATTRIEQAVARIRLPRGLKFVRAIGAPSRLDEGEVTLSLGALSARATRRVVVELRADATSGAALELSGDVTWKPTGGRRVSHSLDGLHLTAVVDRDAVHASRDPRVYASCISALASLQQLEANAAFRRGDRGTAMKLLEGSQDMLEDAESEVTGEAKAGLGKQRRRYEAASGAFEESPSPSAQRTQKRMAEEDAANLVSPTF